MDAWRTTHTNNRSTLRRSRKISFVLSSSDWNSKLPMWRTAFFLFAAIKFTCADTNTSRQKDRPNSEQKEMTSSIDKSTEPIYFLFISKFMLRPKRMWFFFYFLPSLFSSFSHSAFRPHTCVRCSIEIYRQEFAQMYIRVVPIAVNGVFIRSFALPTDRKANENAIRIEFGNTRAKSMRRHLSSVPSLFYM